MHTYVLQVNGKEELVSILAEVEEKATGEIGIRPRSEGGFRVELILEKPLRPPLAEKLKPYLVE